MENNLHSYCEMRLVQVRLVPQRRKIQHGEIYATDKAMGVVLGTKLTLAQALLGLGLTSCL